MDDNQHSFYNDQGKRTRFYTLAINFPRLKNYRYDFFTIEEIIVFEAILTLSKYFRHNYFTFQIDRLMEFTRLKKHSLRQGIDKMEELQILNVIRKGNGKKNEYFLNMPVVITLLPKIYIADPKKMANESDSFIDSVLVEEFLKSLEYNRQLPKD